MKVPSIVLEGYTMTELVRLRTITQVHELLKLPKPMHPLISVIQHTDDIPQSISGVSIVTEFYMISFKKSISGSLSYGRQGYDFQEGTLIFTAPEQVLKNEEGEFQTDPDGWSIIFHPDLIRPFELTRLIGKYTFFSYDVIEALHVSETERLSLQQLVDKINVEINQNIDQHTQRLLVSTLGLILDYCTRFFDRQFYTRTHVNKDVASRFSEILYNYYIDQRHLEQGIPTVAYCGKEMGFSPNYLSDLLKKETGKNTSEHIHSYIVEKAKTELIQSKVAVGQVAYDLGFEYPSHFSKLFKRETGMTPTEYRKCR